MTLLKPLLYFSLFKYPLTLEEVFAFSDVANNEDIEKQLDKLVEEEVIYKIDGFYLCENDPSLVTRRLKGNKMAEEIQEKAASVSKFISKFPYVEGVGISGSLSKGYYDDDGDIDFFIITRHKRLWIARTLLILYKKLFLLNNKKYFCVNYFISEKSLEIGEKNRFTATELATLIPMFGNGSFHQFYDENKWANTFLPNREMNKGLKTLLPVKKPLLSKIIEGVLNTRLGTWVDALFLRITYKKWKVKFNHLDSQQFDVALKSTKNVSKHHPLNFQNKVIVRLNEKYMEYEVNHNITLPLEHA